MLFSRLPLTACRGMPGLSHTHQSSVETYFLSHLPPLEPESIGKRTNLEEIGGTWWSGGLPGNRSSSPTAIINEAPFSSPPGKLSSILCESLRFARLPCSEMETMTLSWLIITPCLVDVVSFTGSGLRGAVSYQMHPGHRNACSVRRTKPSAGV